MLQVRGQELSAAFRPVTAVQSHVAHFYCHDTAYMFLLFSPFSRHCLFIVCVPLVSISVLSCSRSAAKGCRWLFDRRFSDPIVKADSKLWPFQVRSAADDKCEIEVRFKEEQRRFTPEQMSAMVLTKMKTRDALQSHIAHFLWPRHSVRFSRCFALPSSVSAYCARFLVVDFF